MRVLQSILSLLEDHAAGYRHLTHEPTPTSEDSARVRGEPLAVGGKALVLAACGNGQRSPVPVPPQEISARDLNVLFVIVDAAAARYFGVYGSRLGTSPSLDALAREGTVFERAYSQAPQTSRSTASFLTGKYPPPPRSSDWHLLLEDETIASMLAEHGFRTAAFSENPFVVSKFGFGNGFEVFRERFPLQRFLQGPESYQRPDSEATVEEVIRWMGERPEERFFAYVHLLPPHSPYDPPEPFAGRLDSEYSGTVHGSVNTPCEAGWLPAGHHAARSRASEVGVSGEPGLRRPFDRAIDRGAGRARTARADHRHRRVRPRRGVSRARHAPAWESVVRRADPRPAGDPVPCSFWHPPRSLAGGDRAAAARADLARRSEDLAPLRGAEPDAVAAGVGTSGRHRRPVLVQGALEWTTALCGRDRLAQAHRSARGQKKIELYDLGVDPGETVNLAPLKPELVEELMAFLDTSSFESLPAKKVELSEEKRKQLEALGYVD